ncbi:efflux RND transporter periplasmic adaptor subunit [Myxococcota bacterium]|nr:efflux RND transporter periplasmic adaptor subunit [Myxococcota bacterium]
MTLALWTVCLVGLAQAEEARVVLGGETFESALVVPQSGPPQMFWLDTATSAPVVAGEANLRLNGPAEVEITLGATGRPGVYSADTRPPIGHYAGSLTAQAGGLAALWAIEELDVHEDHGAEEPAHLHDEHDLLARSQGKLIIALIVGLLVGFGLGRRRGAAAAAVLATSLSLMSPRLWAHGGDDHGEGGAEPLVQHALSLPIESQLLLGLRTAVAEWGPVGDTVRAYGALVSAPGGGATLRAPVAGVLSGPDGGAMTPGQKVRAGSVLGRLVETSAVADRASAAEGQSRLKLNVAEAKAALALAERDAARAEGLGDSLSERERQVRAQRVQLAQLSVSEAERALAQAGQGAQIRAPFDAVISQVIARPGEQVLAGDEIVRLVSPGVVWAEVYVAESTSRALRPGAQAEARLAAGGGRVGAVVLDLGQEVNPRTGLTRVTLALSPEDGAGSAALRPGAALTAYLIAGDDEEGVRAPAEALFEAEGRSFLFVKTGPEAFVLREVTVGSRGAETVEIHEGLRPGDRVVTVAVGSLRGVAGR